MQHRRRGEVPRRNGQVLALKVLTLLDLQIATCCILRWTGSIILAPSSFSLPGQTCRRSQSHRRGTGDENPHVSPASGRQELPRLVLRTIVTKIWRPFAGLIWAPERRLSNLRQKKLLRKVGIRQKPTPQLHLGSTWIFSDQSTIVGFFVVASWLDARITLWRACVHAGAT